MATTRWSLVSTDTTGSIYNTPVLDMANYKNVRFAIRGPRAAAAAGSATVWFYAGVPGDSSSLDVFCGVVMTGAGGGSVAGHSLRNSVNILGSGGGSMVLGYIHPNFIPPTLQLKYEISGITASASAGSLHIVMTTEQDDAASKI